MFIPLHVKSDYSLGYGTASVDELVDRAAVLGYDTLGLTDLENLYGQVRFHHACRARGLRALTGLELRREFDGRRNFGRRPGRVVLLAVDETGYRSLCRIISRRRGVAGQRGGPFLLGSDPLPLVAGHSQGLYALSDDPSVLETLVGMGAFSRERLGVLLVRPEDPDSDGARQEAARRFGVALVADLDVVFLREADHSLHLLQRAVRQGVRVAEAQHDAEGEAGVRWLRSPAEASILFADTPDALAATEEIASACRLDLGTLPPSFLFSSGAGSADKQLRRLCQEAPLGTTHRALSWTPEHDQRIEEELGVFQRLGLSGFMVTVAEILAHCRAKSIPVAARGSAVSSLMLHLLGGSPVDPLMHGLLFERFLHGGKSEWPDVDLDLPWDRRDEVIHWVYRRFGRDRVAMVAAHHTFQRRSALREGLKAWGVRPALIEALIRALPPEDLAVEQVDFLGLASEVEDSDLPESGQEPGIDRVLPLVQRLIGRPHHIAAHPGGVVISPQPLEDLVPLERAPKGVVITQYDLTAVGALGMMKIDLLGNRCLSELQETLHLAGEDGPSGGLEAISAEDAPTLALVDRAETVGCYQLESPAMRSLLARLPIRRLSDIVAALALIRPGAAAGEAKSAFVRRALGEEPDELIDPIMADRLQETHGMLLYEEDIMVLLSRIGGLSVGEADELRSAIVRSGGDPEILASLEAAFLERARMTSNAEERSEARARRAWAAAARFAAYSFNKAHAASYGHLAYLSAYMKTHHLLEHACALLNHHRGIYPLRTVAGELSRLGVILRGPDVNRSAYSSRLEVSPGAVRVGLDKVNVLSIRTSASLLEDRDAHGSFATLRDLLERVRLPHRELAALVLSGACDGLRPLTSENYPFLHETVLEGLRRGDSPAAVEKLHFEAGAIAGDQTRTHLYQSLVRVRNELRYIGMHLTGHPMALLRMEAERYGCIPISGAVSAVMGSELRLGVTVAAMRRVPTRQGVIQFLTLEDETGLLEAVVLPPAYRRLGERVTTPGPYVVEGKLRRQQGAVHLDVSGIAPFHKRHQPFGRN